MQKRNTTSSNHLQLRWLAVLAAFVLAVALGICIVMFSAALEKAHEIRFSPNASSASVNVRSDR